MTFETGVRVGKYTVGPKLGQGGFGVLYVARDTELERDIAIKFLRPEHAFKEQVVQRFLQEARAAARIHHPGIVTVYESGEVSGTNTRADGTVYIAMELLSGDTLAQRIRQAGRLPYGVAIAFCRQMADALAAAHLAGIVHRDLKPQNIFLVRDPAVVGGERVKVLDFGIAKLADNFGGNMQTHSLVMLGTPMYMSPEQCKSSAKVDTRADIYSLGCILFEMLCGRTPFDGDAGELIAKHQLVDPPTARSLMPELPIELDRLVASMLAKSTDARPQTMSAVIDVLDAIEEQLAPAPESTSGLHQSMDTLAERPTLASSARGEQISMFSKLKSRSGIAGVAALAIALGVCGGVVAMRDDKPASPSAAPVVEVARAGTVDAAEPEVATGSDVTPEPTVPALAEADVGQLAIECRRHAIDEQWAECAACATRVAAIDEVRGLELAAACKDTSEALGDSSAVIATPPKGKSTTTKAKPEPVAAKSCDAEAAKEKGMSNINMGQHAAALLQFEASLRCKDDPYVRQLAFMEACASSNSPKATLYYRKLTPRQQEKFSQICERQKPPVAYKPSGCDPVALKEQGMDHINEGKHADALAQFEASLRCKDDPYVRQLAFMEACASANSPKATLYFAKLTPAQQTKFGAICDRQKPPVPYTTGTCDAEALKEKGMQNINEGQHAAALAAFEASYRCKPDKYVVQLCFVEACASGNSPKAKLYYKKLSTDQQTKFAQICIRQSPPVPYQ